MKISGVIILYNSNVEDVITNIRSYIELLDVLYVFDNSDNGKHYKEELEAVFSTIKYFSFQENKGMAFALNYCAEFAFHSGYDWILTMDQDSAFRSLADFKYYVDSIEKEISDDVALFCPMYPNEEVGREKFFTSGSLMNLDAWKKIGKFNDLLFIDEVDGDFTFRLSEANYSLKKIYKVFLIHSLGEICSKTILGRTFRSDNHAALRKYYIARNRVYLMKKRPGMRFIYLRDSFNKFITFILIEKNRIQKLGMIGRGIYDGLFGRMGKYKRN